MSVAALGAPTHSPGASDENMVDLDNGDAHLHGLLKTHAAAQSGATKVSPTALDGGNLLTEGVVIDLMQVAAKSKIKRMNKSAKQEVS